MKYSGKKIVFYDGDCAICNRAVQFLSEHDSDGKLWYSSLQSSLGVRVLKETGNKGEHSILFFDGNRALTKSNACIEIARTLGGRWKFLTIFKYIPLTIRNGIYDLIAKNRSRLSSTSCTLPGGSLAKRIIG